jgi:hypothetical protein
MELTKFRTSILSGYTATAGINIRTSYTDFTSVMPGQLNIKITNGATGPTRPLSIIVEIANDAAHSVPSCYAGQFIGGTGNNEVKTWSVRMPRDGQSVRLWLFGDQAATDQAVTVDCDLSTVSW